MGAGEHRASRGRGGAEDSRQRRWPGLRRCADAVQCDAMRCDALHACMHACNAMRERVSARSCAGARGHTSACAVPWPPPPCLASVGPARRYVSVTLGPCRCDGPSTSLVTPHAGGTAQHGRAAAVGFRLHCTLAPRPPVSCALHRPNHPSRCPSPRPPPPPRPRSPGRGQSPLVGSTSTLARTYLAPLPLPSQSRAGRGPILQHT